MSMRKRRKKNFPFETLHSFCIQYILYCSFVLFACLTVIIDNAVMLCVRT